jgi:hypothetical protein
MKFKTIKAFEEFFHFGQEEEFAPRERQDNDPAQEDEIINYGDVEEEDEIYGSEYNDPTEQELLPGDLPSDSDCDTCEHEEEDNSDRERINKFDNFFMSSDQENENEEEEEEEEHANWGDESVRLERFSTFNEKKASPAQLAARKAFADRIKGKSDKKDDKKEDKKDDEKSDKKDDKKSDKKEESGKGLTAAQKKLPEGLRKAIEKKKK